MAKFGLAKKKTNTKKNKKTKGCQNGPRLNPKYIDITSMNDSVSHIHHKLAKEKEDGPKP